jgi:hypothetical protein
VKIKRTIKPGWNDRAGQVTFIDEAKMREIILQTELSDLPRRDDVMNRSDEAIARLRESGKIETFYAVYELEQPRAARAQSTERR